MNQDQKRPQVVACPAPEQVTEVHVDICLSIVATLQPYLLPLPRDPHTSIPEPAQRLDGEVAIAAESTFIKVLSRIDALLADETRWTLAPHKELYDAINRNYTQQFEFLKAQTRASNSISRPMFLMKPELVQLGDGSFAAYIGDVTTPGCGLVGRGSTPAEAFGDFDQAFFRAEQVKLEPTPTPKSPRKKK
jgi:hypothetical protein